MWCRAVWKEGNGVEEGTVPDTWIVDQQVCWPRGPSAINALKKRKAPAESWSKFELVKIKHHSGN